MERDIYHPPTIDELQAENELATLVATAYQTLTNVSFWFNFVHEDASDAISDCQKANGWNSSRIYRNSSHEITAWDTKFPMSILWYTVYNGIDRTNYSLMLLNQLDSNQMVMEYIAECKVIRAWWYLQGMDTYGDMPIFTNPRHYTNGLPKRTPRSEVFNFVENELKWSLERLPSGMDPNRFPRINKESVRAILATLYLNAEVYTGKSRWNDCISQCDAILEADGYSLSTDYFNLFSVNNHEQYPEMLFYIDYNAAESTGGSVGWVRASLVQEWVDEYYPELPYTVWNGTSAEPSFYRKYDTTDIRYTNGFLEGVQYTRNGDTLRDENGYIIDHKVDFYLLMSDVPATDSVYRGLYEGVRILKWEPDITAIDSESNNGFPVIRLADIMLQK
ncbi:MAG: RagB/SusD family nutrient uptake outer membrane protein, partial [Desulfobacterales bacterium]|nr:RagB/SusD family nutrient uptake outer membrane protein [Desulfobacterales bacterium]